MKRNIMVLLCSFILIAVIVIKADIYFNVFSNSMPIGLYQKVNGKPTEGAIVASCLNKEIAKYGLERKYLIKGSCDTGIQPVLKMIKGVEGDKFSIINGQLLKNGQYIMNYYISEKDSNNRAVRRFYEDKYTLKKDEYWLISNYRKNSWDSRYWGAVSIEFVLKPLLILKS